MSKLKCNECGIIFESTMDSCPNCGCPASESLVINTSSNDLTEDEKTFLEAAESFLTISKSLFIFAAICAFIIFFSWCVLCFNSGIGFVVFMGVFSLCFGIFMAILIYKLALILYKGGMASAKICVSLSKNIRKISEK